MRNSIGIAMSLFMLTVPLAFADPSHAAPTEDELIRQIVPLKSSADPGVSRLADSLEKGLGRYRLLNDYKALFIKKEIDKTGVLGAEEEIYLKFVKPFKIYLGWLNTHKRGLQVFYERGRHDGKLAIHKPGLFFGLAPVVFLPQDSPWVREGSAPFNIEDAGIGTFLRDFSIAVIRGAQENKLQVRETSQTPSAEIFEVIFPDSVKNEAYFAYRLVVSFDSQTWLPTGMELFDWNDVVIGRYTYRDLVLDVGESGDKDFQKQINRHLHNVYNNKE